MRTIIKAQHLPGIKNHRADALSRLESAGDYEIKDEALKEVLAQLRVRPTLDAFASEHNHKVERWCGVGSPIAEDGLTVPWNNECVLAHPPTPLIPMVIRKAQMEKARAIILLPSWKGQNWDILLRTSNYYSLELNYSSKILLEVPWMKKTGACLPPGKMKVIMLNPSGREVKPGSCMRCTKVVSPWSSQMNARLELQGQHGMYIYSVSRTF